MENWVKYYTIIPASDYTIFLDRLQKSGFTRSFKTLVQYFIRNPEELEKYDSDDRI